MRTLFNSRAENDFYLYLVAIYNLLLPNSIFLIEIMHAKTSMYICIWQYVH